MKAASPTMACRVGRVDRLAQGEVGDEEAAEPARHEQAAELEEEHGAEQEGKNEERPQVEQPAGEQVGRDQGSVPATAARRRSQPPPGEVGRDGHAPAYMRSLRACSSQLRRAEPSSCAAWLAVSTPAACRRPTVK